MAKHKAALGKYIQENTVDVMKQIKLLVKDHARIREKPVPQQSPYPVERISKV